MSSTTANVNPSFQESEATITTIEGTSMVAAQVEVRIMPLS
jgi:hypothetical protein